MVYFTDIISSDAVGEANMVKLSHTQAITQLNRLKELKPERVRVLVRRERDPRGGNPWGEGREGGELCVVQLGLPPSRLDHIYSGEHTAASRCAACMYVQKPRASIHVHRG